MRLLIFKLPTLFTNTKYDTHCTFAFLVDQKARNVNWPNNHVTTVSPKFLENIWPQYTTVVTVTHHLAQLDMFPVGDGVNSRLSTVSVDCSTYRHFRFFWRITNDFSCFIFFVNTRKSKKNNCAFHF